MSDDTLMKKLMKLFGAVIFCVVNCFFSPNTYAQNTIEIAGRNYIIPAFEQMVLQTKNGDFEGVTPIEQSKNNLEIRFSFFVATGKAMIAIRGDMDSLWADCYFYEFPSLQKRDPTFSIEQFTTSRGYQMSMVSKRLDLTNGTDSIVAILLENEIFTLDDENVVLDSLKKNNIPFKNDPWLDGSWGTDFIIKVNSQYRRFSIKPEIDSQNPSMEVFAKRIRLYNLFYGMYRSSRLPVPMW